MHFEHNHLAIRFKTNSLVGCCSSRAVVACLGDEGNSTINGDGEEEDTHMFDVFLVVEICSS